MKYFVDINEGDIRLVIRALRRYNTKGVKYLFFTIFPLLRDGNFENEEISNNRFYIPWDKSFEFVYGKIYVEFSVLENNKIYFILSDKIKYILYSLYHTAVQIVDGIPIIDENALFKYNVYKNIKNR